ncbi:Trk system potassium uptake protein TrkG (plasmid) [Pseudoseohaeicola sp. NH-UV-7]|uniref:TrkH family potassium uptake protein n=1 Tax=Sulfitobacter sp. TBRI5 TaxID=2989732 RepID=UPI003A65301F
MPRSASPSRFLDILLNLPLFLLLVGCGSASMYVPAAYSLILTNHTDSRTFFYAGTLGLITTAMIAIAMSGRRSRHGTLGQLMSLFSMFAFLPVLLAIPFYDALQTTSFLNAYFEMVSAITTTGATMFEDPTRLSSGLHLWRAQVGWMGGLVMWIAASAILAPLNLGGFEVTARAQPGRMSEARGDRVGRSDPRTRLLRITIVLFPIYAGLTLVLWVLLLLGGDTSLVSLCHAMSVMATSGISPIGGVQNGASGFTGEAVMFLFMLFALSRLTFSTDTVTTGGTGILSDPEFRIGMMLVIGVPVLLLLRHWMGSLEVREGDSLLKAAQAFWGSMFTVLSFLTTTGFESADWGTSQNWSGLSTPGLILMGLALTGGGVATTAGGVKLLRVYALYLHGLREMERLVHPSSVSGGGQRTRRIQRDGAYIAWIFFMLFALSLALVTVVLTALGVDFENAVVLSIATLSTTGPLIQSASEAPVSLVQLGPWAKGVLCAAMVLGRLETLAIIALLTPDLWRS